MRMRSVRAVLRCVNKRLPFPKLVGQRPSSRLSGAPIRKYGAMQDSLPASGAKGSFLFQHFEMPINVTAARAEAPASKRAQWQIDLLRQAFQLSALSRSDAADWRELERAIATYLEERRPSIAKRPIELQEQTRELERTVTNLLVRAAPNSDRAQDFRRAVKGMRVNIAVWSRVLDPVAMVYLRYAAAAWIALWHGADTPAVNAGQMRTCFGIAPNAPTEQNPDSRRPAEAPLSKAFGAFASALRKVSQSQ